MLNVLLKNVMTQGYLFVEENQPAEKALGVMRDMRISCVFVLREDLPVGIITERAILGRSITGVDLFSAQVKDIMTTPLIALTPDTTVNDACKLIAKKIIRHIAIVDHHGFLKGTITLRNLANHMSTESYSSSLRVRDVMHSNIVFLDESETLKQAATQMFETKNNCAIISRGGHPVGIISEKDIVHRLCYGQDLEKMTADRVMNAPVIGLQESDSVAQAMLTLRKHRIHRLAVYNNDGQISGVLALIDLVKNIEKILQ